MEATAFYNPYAESFDAFWANAKQSEEYVNSYTPRLEHVCKFSFAVPSDDAIRALLGLGPIFDPMAGTGYWAHVLEKAGADVVAYDIDPYRPYKPETGERLELGRWCEVKQGDCEQVAESHGDRAMLLVWPPYHNDAGERALKGHQRSGGTVVAYVGEEEHGCTGTPAFHEMLAEQYELVQRVGVKKWESIWDALFIYRLREPRP